MTRAVLLFAALGAFAQSTPPPAFEIASVKLSAEQPYGRFEYLKGGRLHCTYDWIKNLIERAYDLKDYQVSGGPNWITSDRYDIEAKAPNENATPAEMRVMLQALLADRFQLKLRQETKEFQVYALVVAKNGPKFKALKEGEGGNCGEGFSKDGYFGCQVTMASLAESLRHQLRSPVFDKTGLEGRFDLKLNYDEYSLANRTPPPDFDQPSLFVAIQDQLGLKLDPQKAPLPVLVIESIQRPTGN